MKRLDDSTSRRRITRAEAAGLCKVSPDQAYRLLQRLTKSGRLTRRGTMKGGLVRAPRLKITARGYQITATLKYMRRLGVGIQGATSAVGRSPEPQGGTA
jgi:hypothetical protein